MENNIYEAIRILKEGGIVIFPTDTAFGIGCRIDREDSIERLFRLRKRPPTQPTPVLCSSLAMVEEYVTAIPDDVKEKLIKPYWPGALTIVLPAKTEKVPTLVRGGGLTVGVRIPDHAITQKLIEGVGVPILGPSANFHGEPTPFKLAEINPKLYSLVDYLLPGVCKKRKASTVIDCSVSPWKILREGAVKLNIDR